MDREKQTRALNSLFTRAITGVKKPKFDLRELVKQYRENDMERDSGNPEREMVDPLHPDHWANSDNKGWIHDPEASAAYAATLPNTQEMMCDLRPVQDDKAVVLTKFHRDLLGQDPPKGPQGIGDCVSWGNGNGVNVHQAVQIVTNGSTIKYQEAMTESIYALARCEVGNQWNSYQDGAVGAWAAKALTEHGCLSRANTGPYDPKRAKSWGAKGLPDELEPEAKLHIYKTAVLVTNFQQAAQLIQAGYPVAVCSNIGFQGQRSNSIGTRDEQGFCKARGKWNHCMVFVGVRFDREGLLCLQSWGPNVPDGPLDLDQPDNSFWVESSVCDAMFAQRDSYSYNSDFSGFKRNDNILDYSF